MVAGVLSGPGAGRPRPVPGDVVSDLSFSYPCVVFALRRESLFFRREFRPQQRLPGAPYRAQLCGPAWLTVLTRIDPVSYGIDSLRRVALGGAGVPQPQIDRLGLTLFGNTLSVWIEVALLGGFGLIMVAVAIRGFRQKD